MSMNNPVKVLARGVLGIAVVVIAVIAGLYVTEVISGEAAKDLAVKGILVLAIVGVASTALLALSNNDGATPSRPS